jgi:hypothetical protein
MAIVIVCSSWSRSTILLIDAAADSDGGGWRGVKTKCCNDGQKAKDWLVLVLAIDGNEMKMELLLQLPP